MMSYKKIKKEFENLKVVVITANKLYYLLILYSDEKIPLPNGNLMKGESIISLKYNIYQMETYIKKLDYINKKLMKKFNYLEYSLEKDELDYLLDFSNENISVSININDIPEYDIL